LAVSDIDDRTLLDKAVAGDAGALEALMTRHAGRVYRLAYGITRNPADAEEVVQDVFLTVVRKGGSFEGQAALATWMYRVTMNAALNRRRGKRRELEVSLEEHLPHYTEDGHRAGDRSDLLVDWSSTPEERVLSGESRRVLENAIDSLPDHYRAVLVLRDVEDLSNEEVASIVGDSLASVKSRLHRARMALREQLTRHFGGRP
jgi:RNA polymerase sigma-70 factor (ECF subfamily)